MRLDGMEALGAVNRWLDLARVLLAKHAQLPLIDERDIDMHAELWCARELGDDSLRAAIDNILSRDPDDLAARFVALNAYYRLMATEIPSEIQFVNDREQVDRAGIMEHLGYLVRLRDTKTCIDTTNIRWEIVNASAVKDYPRILALCDQLKGIVPDGERYYLRGRAHFLIALLHTWDIDESLELWDMPLGSPACGGPRGSWRWVITSVLIAAGIQKMATREALTDDDRDHLRDATKFLEKTISSEWEAPATTRLMLARSYASIGDGNNAARHYQWILDHQDAFFRLCEAEEGPLWEEVDHKRWRDPGIHTCLVNAYDDAGELDKAISAAKTWIEACPDYIGTFERMARLQQKRPDPIAAAEYMRKEADRREVLGDKAYGEDPNVSIILALGGIVSSPRLDETLKNIASNHPRDIALVESVVKNCWPAFMRLAAEDQQQWVIGSFLLFTNLPQGAGTAVGCFARVVEGELRTHIFIPFAEHARSRQEILAGGADDPFSRYVRSGDKTFGLGPMFKVLGFARRPASPLISSFADWLKRGYPWLLAGLAPLRTDKIVDFRNRAVHPDVRLIEAKEAEEASKLCREVINFLYRR